MVGVLEVRQLAWLIRGNLEARVVVVLLGVAGVGLCLFELGVECLREDFLFFFELDALIVFDPGFLLPSLLSGRVILLVVRVGRVDVDLALDLVVLFLGMYVLWLEPFLLEHPVVHVVVLIPVLVE